MGKPASRISTPSSTSWRAIRSFSSVNMLQPGACSPSRSVVSKTVIRSHMPPPGTGGIDSGQATGCRISADGDRRLNICQIYNYIMIYSIFLLNKPS